MPIFSCKNCVPPKRHPGCHGTCPEYLGEKETYEFHMEEYRKQHNLSNAIYAQRGRAVQRAMKHRRKGKYYEQ